MNCQHQGSPMCVGNLITLSGQNTPISLGIRIGLNHAYGCDNLPPCLRGPVGSAYWSTADTDEGAMAQPR
jgi:hypothetical protein